MTIWQGFNPGISKVETCRSRRRVWFEIYYRIFSISCWCSVWIRQTRLSQGSPQDLIIIFPPFVSHLQGNLADTCSYVGKKTIMQLNKDLNSWDGSTQRPSRGSWQKFLHLESSYCVKPCANMSCPQNRGPGPNQTQSRLQLHSYGLFCLSCQTKHWMMGRDQVQDGTGAKIQYPRTSWGPDNRKVKQNSVWCWEGGSQSNHDNLTNSETRTCTSVHRNRDGRRDTGGTNQGRAEQSTREGREQSKASQISTRHRRILQN